MLQNALARLPKIALRTSALAICLAVSSPSVAAPKQAGAATGQAQNTGPALWVVRDHDSTLYLFGTMHALSPATVWQSSAIKNAMADSDEVWFEAEPPTDPTAIQSLVMEFGIDKTNSLSAKLGAADKAVFNEAVAKLGLKIEQADTMRPWFAAMNLAGLPLIEAGYDQTKGADPILLAAARAAGKRIRTFETAEQQMRFFADLPSHVELDLLRETLKSYKDGPAEVRKMEAAWAGGDVTAIWSFGGASMKSQFPAVYAALLPGRNQKWADVIVKELEGKGTDFIAVGTLHLTGPDSVQSLLEARGYKVERK